MSAKRTRVLVCMNNFAGGGAERMAIRLALDLPADRFDVTLLAQEARGPLRTMAERVPSLEVPYTSDARFQRRRLPRLLRVSAKLAKQHDVVIGANEGRATVVGYLAARRHRKPFIGWVHNDRRRDLHDLTWRNRASFKLYRRFDAIVGCSEGASEGMAALDPALAGKVQTILNWVPRNELLARAAEPLTDAEAAWFDKPVVVTTGRFEPQKAQHVLLEAHALVKARGINHRLVMLGEGPLRGELERRADELGVRDSVAMPGFHPNPARVVARSSVFALSSAYEGFSLAIMEALVVGTPVVSTDCPSGPAELLDQGAYGRLVPVGDAGALADGLADWLRDPDELARWRPRAAERGAAFDLGVAVVAWAEVLERVAGRSAAQKG